MLPIQQRRLDRALRKAMRTADANAPLVDLPTPEVALAAAEQAEAMGDCYALSGVGRVDPRKPFRGSEP